MQSIIFYSISILAMAFVLYLAVKSVIEGFNAKNENRLEREKKQKEETEIEESLLDNSTGLSLEIEKLNELYKSGALTKEEFDKAKAKLLEK